MYCVFAKLQNRISFITNLHDSCKHIFLCLFQHESTVAALLSALQVYNGISLPYAAMVIMELHQNTSGQHFVKLFYKNSTVDSDVVETLSIPGGFPLSQLLSYPCLFQNPVPETLLMKLKTCAVSVEQMCV